MKRGRFMLLLAVVVVFGLMFTGCGVVSSAVRLLTSPPFTSTPRVVEKLVVVTPEAQAVRSQEQSALPAPTAAPPVTINIAPGADVETELLTAVYRKVSPSVVYIENLTRVSGFSIPEQMLPESQGSGFVWDTQGHIVTNDHVVRGADGLQVTFADGLVLPAELVGTDPDSDLAVIKVDPSLAPLVPVETGNIDEVQVGQRAIAIGNPFGYVGTMTAGIISAVGRSIPAITGFSIPLAIQTDAAINPGNSGGPLLNERGQVIGVNAQIRSETGTNSGVGFAIPINIVQRVVPALIADGEYRHAWLGVSGQTYTPLWANVLGFSANVRGAYIMDVTDGGPAARAGLRGGSERTNVVLRLTASGPVFLVRGGDLITAIDGQPVKAFDDLLIYLESNKSPGDVVTLTVLRAGQGERAVTVTLGSRPRTLQ